jgi:hypothetical protein
VLKSPDCLVFQDFLRNGESKEDSLSSPDLTYHFKSKISLFVVVTEFSPWRTLKD